MCDGFVENVKNPGRLIRDEAVLYEIPEAMAIPTCLECGVIQDDEVNHQKIFKVIETQKTNKSWRLEMLRYISLNLDTVLFSPQDFGDCGMVYSTVLTLMDMREAVLSKGLPNISKTKKLVLEMKMFLIDDFPGCFVEDEDWVEFPKLHIGDFAQTLRDFCNIWINVGKVESKVLYK